MESVNPSFEVVVAELHTLVKRHSSVPKMAAAIGMNYSSLRDNLLGKSDIRLSTVYAILDELGMTMDDLMQYARVTAEQQGPEAPKRAK